MRSDQIIIVRRSGGKKARGHSSAWKIAFADFTLSMMAVFLVLWVVSMATTEEQVEISRYFNDPGGYFDSEAYPSIIDFGGSLTESAMMPDQGNIKASSEWRLYNDLHDSGFAAVLDQYSDIVSLKQTDIGIEILIKDSENRLMFDAGNVHLQPYYEDLLLAMAPYLNGMGRSMIISGHTDASQYAERGGMDNWTLSGLRANEARKALEFGGLDSDRVLKISARADSALLFPERPWDPENRRIEIIVLGDRGEELGGDDSFGPYAREDSPFSIEEVSRKALMNQYPDLSSS